MLKLKTASHIKTNRHRKSFRAVPTSTGVPQDHLAEQENSNAEIDLQHREIRRWWLIERWNAQVRNATEAK